MTILEIAEEMNISTFPVYSTIIADLPMKKEIDGGFLAEDADGETKVSSGSSKKHAGLPK